MVSCQIGVVTSQISVLFISVSLPYTCAFNVSFEGRLLCESDATSPQV
jgi:hypothetical protein